MTDQTIHEKRGQSPGGSDHGLKRGDIPLEVNFSMKKRIHYFLEITVTKNEKNQYEFALCFGMKLKSSLTFPRNISEIFIQSSLRGDERRISSSVLSNLSDNQIHLEKNQGSTNLPLYIGTRWLILCGGYIRMPWGTYLYLSDFKGFIIILLTLTYLWVKLSHSSRNFLVFSTPLSSLPQCSRP